MEINACPICKQELRVREYYCPGCEVSFKGDFENAWISGLSADQISFIRLFIIVQGNIREMEKRLGISYPTVKNRLNEIIRKIAKSEPVPSDYSDILADLEQGFVSVDEAIKVIEQRKQT